jgi:caffeoyl-CoA O-methyltransferase
VVAGRWVVTRKAASWQVVFLDANKRQYERYLEGLLETGLLPVGGLLVVDNVLWKGRVPPLLAQDEQVHTPHTPLLAQDEQVHCCSSL